MSVTTAGTTNTTRLLTLAAVALCVLAIPFTLLARWGTEPPEAYTIFRRLFTFNDHVQSIAMLLALLLTLSAPRLQNVMVLAAEWMGRHPVRTATTAFLFLALGSRFMYLAHPLSMDEYAPWMQSNAFARGSLMAHYPPELVDLMVPPPFQGIFISVDHSTGAAISKYLPGLALLMAPFQWLKLGWCVNPAFGALALMLIHGLASGAAGNRTAGGWAMLMALASPQFTVNAMSFYAMPGELTMNLLFLWLLLRPDLKSALAAGLTGGLCLAMHNPAPHTLMAVPCLAWMAWNRERWPRLLVVFAGYLPMVVLLVLGWSAMMSIVDSADAATSVPVGRSMLAGTAGFLKSIFSFPDYPMLLDRIFATWKAWIWACPGLPLLLFVSRARSLIERLLIATLITTYLFFLFIRFDQGHGWGYRYIHTAWAALPVAGGLWATSSTGKARMWAGAIAAAGLLATPAFLWKTHETIRETLSWRLAPRSGGDWVIFVAQDTGRYRGDLVQNPPGQTSLLYLVSRGHEADRQVVSTHFPGAVEVEHDRRGSSWRLPDGVLSRLLESGHAGPPVRE